MGCEHTKKDRITFLAAKPSDIRTAEDRKLVTMHPSLLRDRFEITHPTWVCGPGINTDAGECQVAGCREPAEFECDGCDIPICPGHANNRGTQEIVTDTTFNSPGWRRMSFTDSYDLCPFCLFNPEKSRRSTSGSPPEGK